MLTIRRSTERGAYDNVPLAGGRLDTRHTFSFGHYHDPRWMGFRSLRVLNEDRVSPGGGFPTHAHADMEIVSYVLDGALEHRDSLGTGSVIRPGDVQRMSAGSGVRHSEFNHAPRDTTHFLQIWLVPERRGIEPSYEQRHFPEAERRGRLRLIASRDGAEGSVRVHQDARVYATLLAPGERAAHRLGAGRGAWVQVARGEIGVNGVGLCAGDAAIVEGEAVLEITGSGAGAGADPGVSEALLFDLG